MTAPGSSRPVLLAAGGTGGHLFPAEALAAVLDRLGVKTVLVTDERVGHLALTNFKPEEVFEVASATPSGGSFMDKVQAALTLGRGTLASLRLIKTLRPLAVVGFGGYPTVPPVLAASFKGIPTIIHEQNGVIGRANLFLAKRARLIATGFPTVKGLPEAYSGKTVQVGNPVRANVVKAAGRPFPPALKGGKLRLLIFGGSQGAKIMSEVVPDTIARLPTEAIRRIVITQQAREEDILRVKAEYARLKIDATVQPFFKDLPDRIADSHLVISRAGASTIAELAAIGRPAILVPLPGALDNDQLINAQSLVAAGGATLIPQSEFTTQRLTTELLGRLADPDSLSAAAAASKQAGTLDAAERLAAFIIQAGKIALK